MVLEKIKPSKSKTNKEVLDLVGDKGTWRLMMGRHTTRHNEKLRNIIPEGMKKMKRET